MAYPELKALNPGGLIRNPNPMPDNGNMIEMPSDEALLQEQQRNAMLEQQLAEQQAAAQPQPSVPALNQNTGQPAPAVNARPRYNAPTAPSPNQNETLAGDALSALGAGSGNVGVAGAGLLDLATGGQTRPKQEQYLGRGLGEVMGDVADYYRSQYSPETQAQQQDANSREGFWGTLQGYAENPRALAAGVVESIPFMATGAPVLRGAGALGNAAYSGAIGAGMSGADAQQRILSMPEKKLAQSPAYQQLLAQGVDPGAAREQLAQQAMERAAPIAAAISAGAGAIGLPFEKAVATGQLGKLGPKQFAGNLAKEGAEETIQEGGEQFASNVGVGRVDENQAALEGVSESAAAGLASGAASGAALQAPQLIADQVNKARAKGEITKDQADAINEQLALSPPEEQTDETGQPLGLPPGSGGTKKYKLPDGSELEVTEPEIEQWAKETAKAAGMSPEDTNAFVEQIKSTGTGPADTAGAGSSAGQNQEGQTDKNLDETAAPAGGDSVPEMSAYDRAVADVMGGASAPTTESTAGRPNTSGQPGADAEAGRTIADIEASDDTEALTREYDEYQTQLRNLRTEQEDAKTNDAPPSVLKGIRENITEVQNKQWAARSRLKDLGVDPGDAPKQENKLNRGRAGVDVPRFAERPARIETPADEQPVIPPKGRQDKIVTPAGDEEVTIGYDLVNASDLVTSHNAAGAENPNYPQRMQPRDRTQASSQLQIREISQNLDPARVGVSRETSSGAPIIGNADQVVEQGNGRAEGIRQAYFEGRGDQYKNWLAENAEQFGISPDDIAGMDQPVLVRRRLDTRSMEDRINFARRSGADPTSGRNRTEKAKSDAGVLTPGMLEKLKPSAGGDMLATSNTEFMQQFTQAADNGDVSEFVADNQFTQQARERAENAVFQYAYDRDDITNQIASAPYNQQRNIKGALQRVAPQIARMRASDPTFDNGRLDVVTPLMRAVDTIQQSRRQKVPVDTLLNQVDMFDDTGVVHAALTRFMDENINSESAIASGLSEMVNFIENEASKNLNVDLFSDDAIASLPEIIAAAATRIERIRDDINEAGQTEGETGYSSGAVSTNDGSGAARGARRITKAERTNPDQYDLLGFSPVETDRQQTETTGGAKKPKIKKRAKSSTGEQLSLFDDLPTPAEIEEISRKAKQGPRERSPDQADLFAVDNGRSENHKKSGDAEEQNQHSSAPNDQALSGGASTQNVSEQSQTSDGKSTRTSDESAQQSLFSPESEPQTGGSSDTQGQQVQAETQQVTESSNGPLVDASFQAPSPPDQTPSPKARKNLDQDALQSSISSPETGGGESGSRQNKESGLRSDQPSVSPGKLIEQLASQTAEFESMTDDVNQASSMGDLSGLSDRRKNMEMAYKRIVSDAGDEKSSGYVEARAARNKAENAFARALRLRKTALINNPSGAGFAPDNNQADTAKGEISDQSVSADSQSRPNVNQAPLAGSELSPENQENETQESQAEEKTGSQSQGQEEAGTQSKSSSSSDDSTLSDTERERLENLAMLLRDNISLNREKGKVDQNKLNKLAEVEAKLRGEMPEGGVPSLKVFGHPEVTGIHIPYGGQVSNLIPIKARKTESVQSRIDKTQKIFDEINSYIGSIESVAEGRVKASKAKVSKAKSEVNSANFQEIIDIRDRIRDETFPELYRLYGEVEKYQTSDSNATQEDASVTAPAVEADNLLSSDKENQVDTAANETATSPNRGIPTAAIPLPKNRDSRNTADIASPLVFGDLDDAGFDVSAMTGKNVDIIALTDNDKNASAIYMKGADDKWILLSGNHPAAIDSIIPDVDKSADGQTTFQALPPSERSNNDVMGVDEATAIEDSGVVVEVISTNNVDVMALTLDQPGGGIESIYIRPVGDPMWTIVAGKSNAAVNTPINTENTESPASSKSSSTGLTDIPIEDVENFNNNLVERNFSVTDDGVRQHLDAIRNNPEALNGEFPYLYFSANRPLGMWMFDNRQMRDDEGMSGRFYWRKTPADLATLQRHELYPLSDDAKVNAMARYLKAKNTDFEGYDLSTPDRRKSIAIRPDGDQWSLTEFDHRNIGDTRQVSSESEALASAINDGYVVNKAGLFDRIQSMINKSGQKPAKAGSDQASNTATIPSNIERVTPDTATFTKAEQERIEAAGRRALDGINRKARDRMNKEQARLQIKKRASIQDWAEQMERNRILREKDVSLTPDLDDFRAKHAGKPSGVFKQVRTAKSGKAILVRDVFSGSEEWLPNYAIETADLPSGMLAVAFTDEKIADEKSQNLTSINRIPNNPDTKYKDLLSEIDSFLESAQERLLRSQSGYVEEPANKISGIIRNVETAKSNIIDSPDADVLMSMPGFPQRALNWLDQGNLSAEMINKKLTGNTGPGSADIAQENAEQAAESVSAPRSDGWKAIKQFSGQPDDAVSRIYNAIQESVSDGWRDSTPKRNRVIRAINDALSNGGDAADPLVSKRILAIAEDEAEFSGDSAAQTETSAPAESTPSPEEILASHDLKVTKTTTRNNNDVWEVTGDGTKPNKDILGARNRGGIGGKWYGPKRAWSFYDRDPTAELIERLGGIKGSDQNQAGAPAMQSEEPAASAPETENRSPKESIEQKPAPREIPMDDGSTLVIGDADAKLKSPETTEAAPAPLPAPKPDDITEAQAAEAKNQIKLNSNSIDTAYLTPNKVLYLRNKSSSEMDTVVKPNGKVQQYKRRETLPDNWTEIPVRSLISEAELNPPMDTSGKQAAQPASNETQTQPDTDATETPSVTSPDAIETSDHTPETMHEPILDALLADKKFMEMVTSWNSRQGHWNNGRDVLETTVLEKHVNAAVVDLRDSNENLMYAYFGADAYNQMRTKEMIMDSLMAHRDKEKQKSDLSAQLFSVGDEVEPADSSAGLPSGKVANLGTVDGNYGSEQAIRVIGDDSRHYPSRLFVKATDQQSIQEAKTKTPQQKDTDARTAKRLADVGAKMAGKRSQKDSENRKSDIKASITGQHSGTIKTDVEKALNRSTRNNAFDFKKTDAQTPGLARFAEDFKSALPAFVEIAGQAYGGGRGYRQKSFKEAIFDSVQTTDELSTFDDLAADYLEKVEQFASVFRNAKTVEDARAGLVELFVDDMESMSSASSDRDFYKSLSGLANWFNRNMPQSARMRYGVSPYSFFGKWMQPADVSTSTANPFFREENNANLDDGTGRQKQMKRTRLSNIKREGLPDYRNGKDVTPEDFRAAFGFRGVEFGEWVNLKERQESVNLAYDSLHDLAATLGIPTKGISLGGKLGFAFGSRGRGGSASAHYEPNNVVINLTKTKGDGSVAHEWGHALDYELRNSKLGSAAVKDMKKVLSQKYDEDSARHMLKQLLRGIVRPRGGPNANNPKAAAQDYLQQLWKLSGWRTIVPTDFQHAGYRLDKGSGRKSSDDSSGYWGTDVEMFARAFESHVYDRMSAEDKTSPYLVNDWVADGTVSKDQGYKDRPYPHADEREFFNDAFTRFIGDIEWSEDGKPSIKEGFQEQFPEQMALAQKQMNEWYADLDNVEVEMLTQTVSDDGMYWYKSTDYFADIGKPGTVPNGYSVVDTKQNSVGYGQPLDVDTVRQFKLSNFKKVKFEDVTDAPSTSTATAETQQAPAEADTNEVRADSLGQTSTPALEDESTGNVQGAQRSGVAGGGAAGSSGGRSGIRGASGASGRTSGGGARSSAQGVDTDSQRRTDTGTTGQPGNDTARGAGPIAKNHRITDSDRIGVGTEKEKFDDNIRALETLKAIEARKTPATAEEQAILARYVGWGGLSKALKSPWEHYGSSNAGWRTRSEKVRELMTPEEIEEATKSAVNAHYTSPAVIKQMWSAVERMGFKGGRVLEPAGGSGNFLGLVPDGLRDKTKFTTVEMDGLTSRILKQLYPEANNHNSAYQRTKLPENFFDLAISNVPFANITPYDKKHNKKNLNLHDYYFSKSLDLVRPGGLVAFITSAGTMDKMDEKARNELLKRGDIVGSIRLPNDAFMENAMTRVTTDMIFVRKKDGSDFQGQDITGLASIDVPPNDWNVETAKVNSYYARNPDMMLGTMMYGHGLYGPDQQLVSDGRDIQDALSEAINKLPENIISEYKPPAVDNDRARTIVMPSPSEVKEGSYTVEGGQVLRREGSNLVSMGDDFNNKHGAIIKSSVSLRGAMRAVYRAEMSGASDTELQQFRDKLGAEYDSFVSQHGPLHTTKNVRALADDPDLPAILALEKWNAKTKEAKKADIFSKRVIPDRKPVERVDNPLDALAVSLYETGGVDMVRMSKLTGMNEQKLAEQLRGAIFNDPEHGWTHADKYLSGNVREKLRVAREAAAADPSFKPNVEALEKNQPEDIPQEKIGMRIGSPWIPADVVTAFVAEKLKVPAEHFYYTFTPEDAKWRLQMRAESKAEGGRRLQRMHSAVEGRTNWGTSRYSMMELMEDALSGKFPEVFDKSGKDKTLNKEETELARSKLDALQREFKRWAWDDPDRALRLHRIYNDTMNNIKLPESNHPYWGTDLEDKAFPGLSVENLGFKPRAVQANGVWKIMQNNGKGILAHEVGLGKTLQIAMTAVEAKRLGLAKKPLIVGLNSNYRDLAEEMQKAYPSANILVIEAGKGPEVRQRQLAMAATGDWDAVFMSHHTLAKIPMPAEHEIKMMENEKDLLMTAIAGAEAESSTDTGNAYSRGSAPEDRTVKELGKALLALEEKIEKLKGKHEKTDQANTFDELGFDMLIVDEYDSTFKNLQVQTKIGRDIKGVQVQPSGIAWDLYNKTQFLQDKYDGNVVFATATPITNSIAEVYTLQRHMDPKGLKERGIQHFDSWAMTFGDVQQELEYLPEGGGWRNVTRMNFHNMSELLQMTYSFMDVQKATPENGVIRPEMKGGAPTMVIVPQNKFAADYQEILNQRAEAIRTDPKGSFPDNMLALATDGRKLAMHPKMIDPSADDPEETKVNYAANNIKDLYDKTESDKGVQLVFADLGAPKDGKGKSKAKVADDAEGGSVTDFSASEIDDSNYSSYEDLKAKLIAKGIPADEIAFIHDAKGDKQRAALFKKVRSGEIRVFIGSTKMMGTGVNVQNRVVGTHHLDVWWTPQATTQRNGRAIRSGNLVAPKYGGVDTKYYAQESSMDVFMLGKNAYKGRFIDQFMGGDMSVREVEDLSVDTITAEEMQALASGDPRNKQKVDLENKIRKLSALASGEQSARAKAARDYRYAQDAIERYESRIPVLQKDADRIKTFVDDKKLKFKLSDGMFGRDGGKEIDLSTSAGEKAISDIYMTEIKNRIAGLQDTYQTLEKALDSSKSKVEADYARQKMDEAVENASGVLGSFISSDGGEISVEFSVERSGSGFNAIIEAASSESGILTYVGQPRSPLAWLKSVDQKVNGQIEGAKEIIQANKDALPVFKEASEKPFDRAKELADLETEYDQLVKSMTADAKDGENQENPDAEIDPENPNILKSTSKNVQPKNNADGVRQELYKALGKSTVNRLEKNGVLTIVNDVNELQSERIAALKSTAFHGTNHTFDRFDISKIGSGEGTSAFGYGFYFADNADVSREYRDHLADQGIINNLKTNVSLAKARMAELPEDDVKTRNYLQENIDDAEKEIAKRRAKLEKPGRLYQVDLKPSEDEYLDWFEPLSNQSDLVKKSISSVADQYGVSLSPSMTGEKIYYAISKKAGSEKATSEALLAAGIRGNKHLDAGSRDDAGGEQTYNRTIFTDQDIEVTANLLFSDDGSTQGLYDPETKRTFLIAQNIEPEKALGVAMHEIGVHYGLRKMIGNQMYQEVLDTIGGRIQAGETIGTDDARFANAFYRVPGDTYQRQFEAAIDSGMSRQQADRLAKNIVKEEALAYFIEENPRTNLARKIIAAVKLFLRQELGIDINLSNDDLIAIAAASLRRSSRPAGPSVLIAKASEKFIENFANPGDAAQTIDMGINILSPLFSDGGNQSAPARTTREAA